MILSQTPRFHQPTLVLVKGMLRCQYQNSARIGECATNQHNRHPSQHRSIFTRTTSRQYQPCTSQRNKLVSTSNWRVYDDSRSIINPVPNVTAKRSMSDEIRRGTDLLADSLAYGSRRKIILESYAPSGVDVKGLVQVGDMPQEEDMAGEDKVVHMNGSIVAFPDACFLWNVEKATDVTLASLSVVKLYRPTVEYLFIGCDKALLPPELNKIRKEFRKRDIVVEQMDIMNAMGTFNILNGEDRRVACVLIIDPDEEG
mmetsp:Transcript_13945/g.30272  ORF Transcript_13945/g.30272 Transcript_13945/m.30272 type:complete len:257 (-) Transcript_13945:356-1126(-)